MARFTCPRCGRGFWGDGDWCRWCGWDSASGVKDVLCKPSAAAPSGAAVEAAGSRAELTRERPAPAAGDRPWYQEGNLQAVLATHLAADGYRLLQVLSAYYRPLQDAGVTPEIASVDIVAERGPETLWVTVRGYPTGTTQMPAATQSRHWFCHALFDVVEYRTERPDIAIGMGLPDGFNSYLNLVPKVAWLKETAPFRFFWVAEDGTVRVE